tara:strand:+ start:152 stop:559 length:408 start_codon:yes stop_codon:yes gene_type:complete
MHNMNFKTINRFLSIVIFALFHFSLLSAQKQTVLLTYTSELPFQKSNDNEYYNLESTLLIRQILSDINQIIEKKQKDKDDIEFTIIIRNNYGAVQPINYLANINSLNNENKKDIFNKHTYDWINRIFRSNIPYED